MEHWHCSNSREFSLSSVFTSLTQFQGKIRLVIYTFASFDVNYIANFNLALSSLVKYELRVCPVFVLALARLIFLSEWKSKWLTLCSKQCFVGGIIYIMNRLLRSSNRRWSSSPNEMLFFLYTNMACYSFQGDLLECCLVICIGNFQVKELKTAIGPLSERALQYCSDACLRRYLEARNWNLDKAKKMLGESLKWRSTFKPEEIRWVSIFWVFSCVSIYLCTVHGNQHQT